MSFTSLLAIEGADSKENMLVDICLQLVLRCMYESVRIQCRSQKHKAVLQDPFCTTCQLSLVSSSLGFSNCDFIHGKGCNREEDKRFCARFILQRCGTGLGGAFHGVGPAICLFLNNTFE